MHILLIESRDLDHAKSLLSHLTEQGCCVNLVHTPQGATKKITSFWPDLIIFNIADKTLSFADFQQALSKIHLNIPQLIVGEKSQINSSIEKDILVIEPGNAEKLNQTIEEITTSQTDRYLRLPDLTIDLHERQILFNEELRSLTPKEFKLLQLLVNNRNEVLSRKKIMQQVWETDYMGDTRTLDVHIRWLREKIEGNPSRPERLVTIRGVGYRFLVNDSELE